MSQCHSCYQKSGISLLEQFFKVCKSRFHGYDLMVLQKRNTKFLIIHYCYYLWYVGAAVVQWLSQWVSE